MLTNRNLPFLLLIVYLSVAPVYSQDTLKPAISADSAVGPERMISTIELFENLPFDSSGFFGRKDTKSGSSDSIVQDTLRRQVPSDPARELPLIGPSVIEALVNEPVDPTPFNPYGSYNTFLIKGKILPWFGMVAAGINCSLGIEQSFFKRHSISIDYYSNWYHFDPPDVYDSVKQQYNGGYSDPLRERAGFVNYRCYLDPRDGLVPYVGMFVRYGRIKHTFGEEYIKWNKLDYVKETEKHYSGGVFFGMMSDIVPRCLGIDVYLGLFYKQKYDIRYLKDPPPGAAQSVTMVSDNFGFRIGLNLYVWFRENARKNRQ